MIIIFSLKNPEQNWEIKQWSIKLVLECIQELKFPTDVICVHSLKYEKRREWKKKKNCNKRWLEFAKIDMHFNCVLIVSETLCIVCRW